MKVFGRINRAARFQHQHFHAGLGKAIEAQPPHAPEPTTITS